MGKEKTVPPEWISRTDLAEELGRTGNQIYYLGQQGIIKPIPQEEVSKRVGKGRITYYEKEPTIKAAVQHFATQSGKKKTNEIVDYLPAGMDPSNPKALDAALENPDLPEEHAKRIAQILKARKENISLKRESGALIERDAVLVEQYSAGKEIREAIMEIPMRLADRLAQVESPDEIEKILSREIIRALKRLSEPEKHGMD